MQYDVSLQTIAWINDLNNAKSLEINPDFQRRAVWLEKERAQLMNTVVYKLPFPEVYYQIVTDPESGRQKYIVVDGQQRTTTILMFINNEFPLPEVGAFSGKYFRDLDTTIKEEFWNYKVVIRFLKLTNDAEIRDLFERLNTNNVKLTDQELRNARYVGQFKEFCEKMADSPLFNAINLFTAREVRRMQDIEFVSELVLQQIYGVTNKKDMLDVAYSKFDEDLPNETKLEEEFEIVIAMIKSLVTPDNIMLIKTKTNFYTLFGALLAFLRETGNESLSDIPAARVKITQLLFQVREEGGSSSDPEVRQYSEAYSRAASDKSRRVTRQSVLRPLFS